MNDTGIGVNGISRGSIKGCGLVFIVLGMAFFYSFGYYGFSIAAAFLVIGMCLIVAGSVSGVDKRTRPRTPSIPTAPTPKSASKPTSSEREDTLLWAAKYAYERGFMEIQQDPHNPGSMIKLYRCPSCGNQTDFRDVNIQGRGIVCTYCRHRVGF